MPRIRSNRTRYWDRVGLRGSWFSTNENQPDALDEDSPVEEKEKYEKWMKTNPMCLMILQRPTSEAIRVFPNMIVLGGFHRTKFK